MPPFRPVLLSVLLALPALAQYQRDDVQIPKAQEKAIQASRVGAGPRKVAPRGPLQPGESFVIQAFKQAKGSVVFINATIRLQNLVTGNVLEIPPGTGTGFVWDDLGHVVTNLHVVTFDLPPDTLKPHARVPDRSRHCGGRPIPCRWGCA